MESVSLDLAKVHILRIDPGEDVLRSVQSFLEEKGVHQAIVLGGYGTLAASHLHWVKDNKIPAREVFGREEGGIEILSMNGLVVDSQAHIHVTLSTPEGAYGGHLENECIAYVLCEVFLGEVAGSKLSRERVEVDVEGMGKGTIPRLTFH